MHFKGDLKSNTMTQWDLGLPSEAIYATIQPNGTLYSIVMRSQLPTANPNFGRHSDDVQANRSASSQTGNCDCFPQKIMRDPTLMHDQTFSFAHEFLFSSVEAQTYNAEKTSTRAKPSLLVCTAYTVYRPYCIFLNFFQARDLLPGHANGPSEAQ